jgi:hypothetical protein
MKSENQDQYLKRLLNALNNCNQLEKPSGVQSTVSHQEAKVDLQAVIHHSLKVVEINVSDCEGKSSEKNANIKN